MHNLSCIKENNRELYSFYCLAWCPWRNGVEPVYEIRGFDSQDFGGLTPSAPNSRRITNPDMFINKNERIPQGLPEDGRTDLFFPTSSVNAINFTKEKDMQSERRMTGKEGFTFRAKTDDPPWLGFGYRHKGRGEK